MAPSCCARWSCAPPASRVASRAASRAALKGGASRVVATVTDSGRPRPWCAGKLTMPRIASMDIQSDNEPRLSPSPGHSSDVTRRCRRRRAPSTLRPTPRDCPRRRPSPSQPPVAPSPSTRRPGSTSRSTQPLRRQRYRRLLLRLPLSRRASRAATGLCPALKESRATATGSAARVSREASSTAGSRSRICGPTMT